MAFRSSVVSILTIAAISSVSPASAQISMPKFGGLGGGGAAQPGAQGAFFVNFTRARLEINSAQTYLAQAFDLKDEITLLEAEKTTLTSGALDKDGYKKSKEISQNVNAKLSARMVEGAALSDEGRKYYQASIPHLLAGTLITVQLVGDAQALSQSAQAALASGSMMEKVKLAGTAASAAMIAKDIPGFVMRTARHLLAEQR
jgi:hypothetical protein